MIGASLINWRLLVLSVVLAPFLIFVVAYFNRKLRAVATSIIQRNAGFHEVLLEALNNIFTVQAFTTEADEKKRFAESTGIMRRMSLKMIFYTGLSKPFTELIGVGMVAITVVRSLSGREQRNAHFLSTSLRKPMMTVPDLLIFFGLLIGASDPLRKLSGVSVSIFSGAMSANLLYGILESKSALPEPENPATLPGRHRMLG